MNMLIDIHTHILPHMDDGAESTHMSIEMLKAESAQGVKTVVLTPHYYPQHESVEQFLARRESSYSRLVSEIEKLPQPEQAQLPQMILGAEAAWSSRLLELDVRSLCIGSSRSLLLELPMDDWNQKMVNQIYDLQTHHGVLPIFAHFDRYLLPENKEYIPQLFAMKLPIQIGADPFLSFFERGKAISLIKKGHGHLIASDCHNLTHRAPNLLKAMQVIEKKLGEHVAENLCESAQNLID